MKFEWSDRFILGIPKIDRQHQQLCRFINTLYDNIVNGDNRQLVQQSLYELKVYALQHISDEEKFLKKHGYHDYTNHQKKHASLMRQIENYYKRYNAGQLNSSIEIYEYIVLWFTNHVGIEDKKYAKELLPLLKEEEM